METHLLTIFARELSKEFGAPRVLDVEHSIQVHRPTLTGSRSVASHYIRPPDGMNAEELLHRFEEIFEFERMNLTLTSIMGIDTYHQPVVSLDDFAKKYFNDNHHRILRVVGKSDQALAAIAGFMEGLKPAFDAAAFPRHEDFLLSGFRAGSPGRAAEIKLLFKPADPTQLMKVEREVKLHISEINLSREILVSRHSTREQPPELILSSLPDAHAGPVYLEEFSRTIRAATPEEVAEATLDAQRTVGPNLADAANARVQFGFVKGGVEALPAAEQKRRVMAGLADILTKNRFGSGLEIKIIQGGTGIAMTFPRTAASLWMSTTFDERKHIKEIAAACIGVRADPFLREGWNPLYRFDKKAGELQIKAVDADAATSGDWKPVPNSA